MKLHTLTKMRRAFKGKDGHDGILYVHQWPTGFQELIFATEELASQFLESVNRTEDEAQPVFEEVTDQ